MEVIIKLPDKDPQRVFNYFYDKCLDSFALGEIDSFEVRLGLPDGTELKKGRKSEPKPILIENEDEEDE